MTITPQTNSTINGVKMQRKPDIPQRGVNLAKRVISGLKRSENGRLQIEIIEAHDGTWLLFVDGGKREVLK